MRCCAGTTRGDLRTAALAAAEEKDCTAAAEEEDCAADAALAAAEEEDRSGAAVSASRARNALCVQASGSGLRSGFDDAFLKSSTTTVGLHPPRRRRDLPGFGHGVPASVHVKRDNYVHIPYYALVP